MLTSDRIIAKCRSLLDDPYPGIQWSNDELVGWINTAQNATANYVPGTTATYEGDFAVVAGTRQELEAGASRLLRVIGNSGNSPATPIRLATFKDMETNIPNWRSTPAPVAGKGFQYYLYDFDDPTGFFLYPQGADGKTIAIVYSKAPKDVEWRNTGEVMGVDSMPVYKALYGPDPADPDGPDVEYDDSTPLLDPVILTTLDIPDVYENAIIDYVLFRAWLKPPQTQQRQALSAQREQAFLVAVQGSRQVDAEATPEADRLEGRGP